VNPRMSVSLMSLVVVAGACLAPRAATAQTWRSFPSDAGAYAAQPGRVLPHAPVSTAGTYVVEVGPAGPAGKDIPPATVSAYGPYQLEPGERYLVVIRPNGVMFTMEGPEVQSFPKPAGSAQVYVRNEVRAQAFTALRFVMADPRCTGITGTWQWLPDQRFVITVDGRFGELVNGRVASRGGWACAKPSARAFVLTHDRGGHIDKVTLSADGTTLTGANEEGEALRATRIK
jgi:hypothetical protein